MKPNRHGVAIKARRAYHAQSFDGVPQQSYYVTGFADVNGERWCRVRDTKATRTLCILLHPDTFVAVAR